MEALDFLAKLESLLPLIAELRDMAVVKDRLLSF